MDRLLDPYDPTTQASLGSSGAALTDLTQVHANTVELLERHIIDPTIPVALGNIADTITLTTVVTHGMGDILAGFISSEGARLILDQHHRKSLSRQWVRDLDLADYTNIAGAAFDPAALRVGQLIVADHLTGILDTDYGIRHQPPPFQLDVCNGSLITFMVVNSLLSQ